MSPSRRVLRPPVPAAATPSLAFLLVRTPAPRPEPGSRAWFFFVPPRVCAAAPFRTAGGRNGVATVVGGACSFGVSPKGSSLVDVLRGRLERRPSAPGAFPSDMFGIAHARATSDTGCRSTDEDTVERGTDCRVLDLMMSPRGGR